MGWPICVWAAHTCTCTGSLYTYGLPIHVWDSLCEYWQNTYMGRNTYKIITHAYNNICKSINSSYKAQHNCIQSHCKLIKLLFCSHNLLLPLLFFFLFPLLFFLQFPSFFFFLLLLYFHLTFFKDRSTFITHHYSSSCMKFILQFLYSMA